MSYVIKEFVRKTVTDWYSGPVREEPEVKEPNKTNDCKNNLVEPHSIEHLRKLHKKAVATKDVDKTNSIIRDVNTQLMDLARCGEDLTVTLFDIEERITSQICANFNKSGYTTSFICEGSDVCAITITVPKVSRHSYQPE